MFVISIDQSGYEYHKKSEVSPGDRRKRQKNSEFGPILRMIPAKSAAWRILSVFQTHGDMFCKTLLCQRVLAEAAQTDSDLKNLMEAKRMAGHFKDSHSEFEPRF